MNSIQVLKKLIVFAFNIKIFNYFKTSHKKRLIYFRNSNRKILVLNQQDGIEFFDRPGALRWSEADISFRLLHRRRRRLKAIHSRSDTNRTGAEGLSFYYPKLLHCLNQMLAVVLLSQHRVLSSKTVRPRAPCGARCIGHAVSTWPAVCSEAPHSQFGEGARPHLCMDEWNRPTPIRRRLSLTQAARGKPIPTGLALVPGTKARSLEAPSEYSVFHL